MLPPRFHALLGRPPDREIARRAGVSATTVLMVRRRLGIAAQQGRDLDAIPPADELSLIRARARSVRAFDLKSSRLGRLAQRHFGGWNQAVEAAGWNQEGRPRKRIAKTARK